MEEKILQKLEIELLEVHKKSKINIRQLVV